MNTDDFPNLRKYFRSQPAPREEASVYEVRVETLNGKWVGVISYHGRNAKQRAKDMARTLNLVTSTSEEEPTWARVRRAKS